MWKIETTDTFDEWFEALDDIDKENVLASILLLQHQGPMLSRPYADTVYGSIYNNLKELRTQSKGKPIRSFYAFNTKRQGILLCAGKKSESKRFYNEMIIIAECELEKHLNNVDLNNTIKRDR